MEQLKNLPIGIQDMELCYMGGVCGARGGVIGVFNDDQKSAINKLKETITIDDETCYLFLVECSGKNQLDENDKQESKTVSGYIPRAYQFGFIYNELTNSSTIAHELIYMKLIS